MYITRFNKEVLQVDEAEDQVLLTAFQVGLSQRISCFQTKNPPAAIADLLFKAQKYMNAEDVLASQGITKRRRREKKNEDPPKWRKEGQFTHSP